MGPSDKKRVILNFMGKKVIIIAAIISLVAGGLGGIAGGMMAPYAVKSGWFEPLLHAQPAASQIPAAQKESAPQEDEAVTDIVDHILPSVVSINITKEVTDNSYRFGGPGGIFDDPFFSFPLPEQQQTPDNQTPERMNVGGGTGFFVTKDGMIATNRHVIEDKNAEYTVITLDGRELKASVVAVDSVLDLGFLKVDAADNETFPALEFGDSDNIKIGETVIAIGNALAEFQNTVTKGIISGTNRRIVAGSLGGSEVIEEAIQTDAAINPGNSGGPLIDLHGQVVGMNTAVSDGAQSLGFALPANAVKIALESVQKNGRIVRPWLGVRYVPIDRDYADQNKLDYDYGAHVVFGTKDAPSVIPDSPADHAGIKPGDIILEIDGQRIDSDHSLSMLLSRHAPGDTVTLKIARDGKEMELQVTLDERTAETNQ